MTSVAILVPSSGTGMTPVHRMEAPQSDVSHCVERYNTSHTEAPVKPMQNEQGQLILEGIVRIHWGLTKPIQFQQDNRARRSRVGPHRSPRSVRKGSVRESYRDAITNGVPPQEAEEELLARQAAELKLWSENFANETANALLAKATPTATTGGTTALDGSDSSQPDDCLTDTSSNRLQLPCEEGESDHPIGGVRLRRPKRAKTLGSGRINRRASINGHFYKAETSANFLPPFGSDTPVVVTDLDTPGVVIGNLLSKFKVENPTSDFALYIDKRDGAMHTMKETDHPLCQLLLVDPADEPRIFLMEKRSSAASPSAYPESGCDANANTPKGPGPADSLDQPAVVIDECRISTPGEPLQTAVADFMNLPAPMLDAFLKKYEMEEKEQENQIRNKYIAIQTILMDRMENFVTHL